VEIRPFLAATVGAVAALATVVAVSWRAAEEQRGLDNADLRSVILISVVVWIATSVLTWRSGRA
jgi:hypothetical protein